MTFQGRRSAFSRMMAVLAVVTAMVVGCTMMATGNYAYADAVKDNTKIVLMHTNDVHCAIENMYSKTHQKDASVGYECVSGEYNALKEKYSCTSLIDAGDNLQGAQSGAFSKGKWPVELMNKCGYAVSAVGNHEFDYDVPRLLELTKGAEKVADFPYISCNFIDLRTGDPVFEPYRMQTYNTSEGEKKVALIGVTTPETLSSASSKRFEDEDGNRIYGFCEDFTGEKLYTQIQKYVDEVRNNGADYVILTGHLGQDGVEKRWRSDTVASKLTGIDAIIDGHSHEEYIQNVSTKGGKTIPLVQTGTSLAAIGEMTIDAKTGTITAELKNPPLPSDKAVNAKVNEILNDIEAILGTKIGYSAVKLYAKNDDNSWAVRVGETNLSDLVTDSFRKILKTDATLINAGGIRDNIDTGELTIGKVFNVFPFLNDTTIIEATGQQIIDALEFGARKYPEPFGGLLHTSGITYKIDKSIPSSVVVDESGGFIKVDGEYRVYNVRIGGKILDLNKKYTVSGASFLLCNGGDGMTMFKGSENLLKEKSTDIEYLLQYIIKNLDGYINKTYEGKNGQGRIVFTDGKPSCEAPELISATNVTRGVKVRWSTVKDADGYYVYRKKASKWKKIKTISSANTLSYIDSKVANGKKYRYTVKAYNDVGSGKYNKKGIMTVRLNTPVVYKLNKSYYSRTSAQVTAKWIKNKKATGYVLYCKAKGINKKVTLKRNVNKKTFKNLKLRVNYDVKIRTFKKVDGKRYYSAYGVF